MRYERRPSSTRCHRSSAAYRLPHKRNSVRKRTTRAMDDVRDTRHSRILSGETVWEHAGSTKFLLPTSDGRTHSLCSLAISQEIYVIRSF